jgi:hypothetical protein
VPVEILACPVVAHCGAWVGVACGDLNVAEADSCVEHGGDEGVPEHVRVSAADAHSAGGCEVAETAGGGVPVHPGTARVQQDRPVGPAAASAVDGPADGGRQRDEDHFGALAADPQDAVAVFLAEVGDIGTGGFEDPQAQQAEHGDEGEVGWVR